jgi:hypothetical protein
MGVRMSWLSTARKRSLSALDRRSSALSWRSWSRRRHTTHSSARMSPAISTAASASALMWVQCSPSSMEMSRFSARSALTAASKLAKSRPSRSAASAGPRPGADAWSPWSSAASAPTVARVTPSRRVCATSAWTRRRASANDAPGPPVASPAWSSTRVRSADSSTSQATRDSSWPRKTWAERPSQRHHTTNPTSETPAAQSHQGAARRAPAAEARPSLAGVGGELGAVLGFIARAYLRHGARATDGAVGARCGGKKVGDGGVVADPPSPDNEHLRRGEYPWTARPFGW